MYKTDGTPSGTNIFYKTNTTGSSDTKFLYAENGSFYFAGRDSIHGSELWKSNGTSTGTNFLADIKTGPAASSPSLFFKLDTTMYVYADGPNQHQWYYLTPTVGINETSQTSFVNNIYPNPFISGQILRFNEPVDEITVFDITGKEISSQIANNTLQFILPEEITPGLYLVKCKKGNKEGYSKIIKN